MNTLLKAGAIVFGGISLVALVQAKIKTGNALPPDYSFLANFKVPSGVLDQVASSVKDESISLEEAKAGNGIVVETQEEADAISSQAIPLGGGELPDVRGRDVVCDGAANAASGSVTLSQISMLMGKTLPEVTSSGITKADVEKILGIPWCKMKNSNVEAGNPVTSYAYLPTDEVSTINVYRVDYELNGEDEQKSKLVNHTQVSKNDYK